MSLKRLLIGLICLAFFIGCGSGGSDGGAKDATNLSGEWIGTYTCSQGLTGLTLELTGINATAVEAVFNFYAVETNPGVPMGSFNMRGTYESERILSLNADEGDWIEQPSGYSVVDLRGTVSADLLTYTGEVSGLAGCTTFELAKK